MILIKRFSQSLKANPVCVTHGVYFKCMHLKNKTLEIYEKKRKTQIMSEKDIKLKSALVISVSRMTCTGLSVVPLKAGLESADHHM